MTLNVASLSVRGLRNPRKCVLLLGELSNFCVGKIDPRNLYLVREIMLVGQVNRKRLKAFVIE